MEKKRIGVKDLVNIGIFAVLYFIAFFIAGITGFIPVMTVFYCLSYLLGRSAMIKFQNVSFGYKDSAQKNSLFAKRQSW